MLHDWRAEVDIGLEFDREINPASDEALGVEQAGGAVEAIVGDKQFDAGSLGIALDALFDQDTEAHIALQVGEAEDQLLAVFRRGFLRGGCGQSLQSLGGQHFAVVGRQVEGSGFGDGR